MKMWLEGAELVLLARNVFCFVIGPRTLSITIGKRDRGFLLHPGQSTWFR